MVRISDLLAYIRYFIVTVIMHSVQCAANLAAAASRLVVGLDGRLPACYTKPKNLLSVHPGLMQIILSVQH